MGTDRVSYEGADLLDGRSGFHCGVQSELKTVSYGYNSALHDDDGSIGVDDADCVEDSKECEDVNTDVDEIEGEGEDEVLNYIMDGNGSIYDLLNGSVGPEGSHSKGKRRLLSGCAGREDLFYGEAGVDLFMPDSDDMNNVLGLGARVREDGFTGYDF